MIHVDLALAQRLERASAALGHDAVQAHRGLFPHSEAAFLECGSGVAVFLNEESPLTQIRGAGYAEFSLDEVEEFFASRMAPVTLTLTPFAHPALFTNLTHRGYDFGTFENTLIRAITAADITDEDPAILPAADAKEWSELMSEAFFGVAANMGRDLAQTLFALPTCQNFIVPSAAGAQLDIRDNLAIFQCDGTIQPARGHGLQNKLIRHRLSLAAQAGCDLATADVTPGSQSQRNYERHGFQVAYTKVTMLKPAF